jgi:hypothetical protein
MALLPERLARIRAEDPQRFRVGAALSLLFLVLVLRVAFGDNPWQDGLAERAAEGKDARPVDYWVTYGWYAMCFAALVVAAFGASLSRWLPGEAHARPELPAPVRTPSLRVALAVVVVVGGLLAAPRLTQGLWQDEDHTVRAYVTGAYLADESGELRFWRAKWRDALLYDWGPNNSIVYSLVARSVDQAWKLVVRPRDLRPREWVVRLPAFVFGLLSLAAVAWLGAWLGFPWGGVGAAAILALHPWHLRFASEVRGYSLVMLLTTLGPILLLRALRLGTWGRWCAYGAAQAVLLWTYPSAIYPVAAMNAAALAMVWSLYGSPGAAPTQWVRFACVNVWGGAAWLVLMAGNIAIMSEYLASKTPRSLGLPWLREFGSQLLSGATWQHGRRLGDPIHPELARRAAEAPWVFDAWVAATCLLLGLGVVRLLRESRFGGAWVWVFLLPAPLGWAVAALREDFLYTRNLSFALPALALLVGIGLDAARRTWAWRAGVGAGVSAVAIAWVLGFVWASQPPRAVLRERAFQPYRDAVALTRPLDPFAPGQRERLTASFSGEPHYYDPFVQMIDEADELRALMDRSRAEGVPLFVNFGRLELARRRKPEVTALVERSDAFEEVGVFHGFAPKFTQRVFRFTGREP